MDKVFLILCIIIFFSCSNHRPCLPGEAKDFLTIELKNNGAVSYDHHILAEGLTKDCDSATVMNVVKSYMQGTVKNTPISCVEVFNSIKHFDRGETLSQPKALYGDSVVEVWFDASTGEPRKFYFFNNNGNKIYEGERWKP